MLKKSLRSLIIFLVVTIFAAIMFQNCTKKNNPTLKRKVFVRVLGEFTIIEKLAISPEKKARLFAMVLDSLNINPEVYRATREKYHADPEYWMKVFKEAEAYVKSREKELNEPPGRSVDKNGHQ